MNPKNMRHKIYTDSGNHCCVIPYSSVVWWIASWAEGEQLQGKNSLARRGVLVLGELEWLGFYGFDLGSNLLLWWWLALFIEALVLFPNVGGKGSNNGQI